MRVAPPPGQLIDVGSHRLHLHCQGAGGPAVVFDAALGASSLSWTVRSARGGLVRPRLCGRSRGLRVERRGAAAAHDAAHRGGTASAARRRRHATAVHAGRALVRRSHRAAVPAPAPGGCRRPRAARSRISRGLDAAVGGSRSARSPGRTAVPLRASRRTLRHHGLVAGLARAGAPGGARVGRVRREPGRTAARGRGSHGARGEAAAGRARDRAAILDAAEVLRSPRQPDRVDRRERRRGSRGSGFRRCAGGRRVGRDELGCGPARTPGTACRALHARAPRHRRAQRPLDSARSPGRGGRRRSARSVAATRPPGRTVPADL